MTNVQGARTAGNFAPIAVESDAAALPVRGELPRELAGTFYRNGPNPRFASPTAHWFVGDGMVHAFTLENGGASYRNRWVRTPKWLAENDAGRALFGGFGQVLPGFPAGASRDGGVANTNVVWHGGRLLALEEGHLPVEIAPRTLTTRGYHDFAGALAGPFTAHPKIDPVTGDLVFFGYHATGPFSAGMTCGTIDAAGGVTRLHRFEAPFASMVHDFAVTERRLLFPVLPLTASLERARSGRPPYAWEPDKGSVVGVMRRDGTPADMVWFRGEACYVFHVLNAWDEGDRVVADVMEMAEAPFPPPDGSPTDPAKSRARLRRWVFDLAGGTDRFTRTTLDDLPGEFPRIDDRRAGFAHRHGWYAGASAAAARSTYDGLVHVDAASGRRTTHFLPAGDAVSEPVFVPRVADAPEGDGWVLTIVWRGGENRSELAVFAATDIERGPIATVGLPHRVPFGLHGNWVAAA
ncbi:MAG: carotenoid oxygenase family protein [Alphaproteobacteria bacterium]|nr:carotenoid oxygenase family protein [Alphaproteobacteria bacterium]